MHPSSPKHLGSNQGQDAPGHLRRFPRSTRGRGRPWFALLSAATAFFLLTVSVAVHHSLDRSSTAISIPPRMETKAAQVNARRAQAATTSTAPSTSTPTTASGNESAQFLSSSADDALDAGIYRVWGPATDADTLQYMAGGQIVLDWSKWETARNRFDWSELDTKLRYYAERGKSVTVQFNSAGSTSKPRWIFDYVQNCGSIFYGIVGSQVIPKYWSLTYLAIMQEAISALANHLRDSPYRSTVLGVRASPNMIGTELWRIPSSSSCASSWSVALGKQYYEKVMRQYHNTLLGANIRPILRANLFTQINTDPALRSELLGPDKSWIFGTASSPDPDLPGREALDEFAMTWVRTGRTKAYWEQSAHSMTSGNPVSWNYWHDLLELHKGVSFAARYTADLREAADGDANDAEYRASFDFFNRYAGHHLSPKLSPGAWIAFRGGRRQPTGNYGWFLTQVDPGSTVALDSASGRSMIGPTDQRFGRHARRTDIESGRNHFTLRLDPTFKDTVIGRIVHIKVTYLDVGAGSWTLRWGTGATDAVAVPKTGTGRWRVTVVDVPASSIGDIMLKTGTSDTTFHMVEVAR
jgi:hypothetical protein